ncbi:AAA family ATPase [Nocardia sp. NPDC055321]
MRDEAGIRGRGPELVRLDQLLADARAGHGAALAIHGEPGTGKSALLRAAVRRATGFRVLECAGDPAESSLPHAALHQLLLPVHTPLSTLPEPQAAALESALALRPAQPPALHRDSPPGFTLGAALLTLFTTLAAEAPLLLAVDDAHLLDLETAQALHFAVRRATNLPVLLLCCLPPEAPAPSPDSSAARPGNHPAAPASRRFDDPQPTGSRLPGAASAPAGTSATAGDDKVSTADTAWPAGHARREFGAGPGAPVISRSGLPAKSAGPLADSASDSVGDRAAARAVREFDDAWTAASRPPGAVKALPEASEIPGDEWRSADGRPADNEGREVGVRLGTDARSEAGLPAEADVPAVDSVAGSASGLAVEGVQPAEPGGEESGVFDASDAVPAVESDVQRVDSFAVVADRRVAAGDPRSVVAGWYRLPALVLGGLDDRAARELIEERHGALPALRVERVLAVAGGNPLALRELPVGAEEFGGSAFGPVPVGERLRGAYRDRISGLDAGVRELLLLAVVEERGVLRVLLDAARELGIDESAWEAAESAGVLAVGDGRVRLGTPLLGMAVHDAATPERRRAAHLALAGALTAPGELDQRVCHRAAALRRPDEQLALALTHGAEQVRGGVLTAAAMLRRAAAITPDPVHASTRLAAAARFSWAGGDIESARRLLDRATEWIGADRAAAASGGLAGLLEFVAGEPERAGALLLRDAALLDGETSTGLRELADRANWAAALADPAPVRTRDLEFGGRLHAEITPAAVRQLPPAPLVLLWGKADRAVEPFTRRVAQLRESGERAAAVHLLPQLAIVQFANGRVAAAQESLTEAFELARATGTGNVLAQCWNLHAKIAAMRGDSDLALESLDRALALARPRRAHALIASAHWHLGFHALSVGDPETAYLRLRALAQPGHDARHPTYARLAAMDMVEAATRVGRPAEAAEHYTTVRSWAVRSRADWAVASAYACRALISTDEERADHYFRRALAVRRTRHDLNQARTHLLYGAWLRRVRRRADAAEQLRTALESFERMSATPWADRARQELDLTGRRTPTPDRGSAPVLTAQEFRVARMAAQGMTNREIGVDLLLSPRTVGHHLSRVFAKLGLTARGELARIDFDNGLRLIPPN